MELDDEICLCFHVTQRKVINFLRIEKPRCAAQLSECFGAGTGCGWCRDFLQQLFLEAENAAGSQVQGATELPNAEDYSLSRKQYIRAGKGQPPDENFENPERA